MHKYLATRLKALLPVLLMVSSLAVASPEQLREAVSVYYAGKPQQAVDLIKPLALAGDVEAQYLLGNILYSLSKTAQSTDFESPINWYQMAADQGVADANYALGVIYGNHWNRSNNPQQAALGITHYQKALDQGFGKAEPPLRKLISGSGLTLKKAMKLAIEKSPPPAVIAEPVSKPAKAEAVKVEAKLAVIKPVVETEPPKMDEAEKDSITVPELALSDQAVAESEANSDGELIEIELAEVVDQCTKYTPTGYEYYAQTIVGAWLTGKAKIKSIRNDAANPGSKIFQFDENDSGMKIAFTLKAVPDSVASQFQSGSNFEVNSVINASKLEGTSCSVDLSYRLAAGN